MRVKPNSVSDLTVSWGELYNFMQWEQGEHVSIIGPTGQGKTYLMNSLLPKRKFVVALATKPKDPTMDQLHKQFGFRIRETWPPTYGQTRVILWPKIRYLGDRAKAKRTFEKCLEEVFRAGGWTIAVDEMLYLAKYMNMGRTFEEIYLQGRSLKLSLVGAVQRPKFVTLLMYDQATHLFFFRDNDETNLRRIGGIGWTNSKEIQTLVSSLPARHFLYVCSRTGDMRVSKVER